MLAENLLNMKQANLSPLLMNPKPWQAMTQIIRNRFIVMYLWLNDENRIEKLNMLTYTTQSTKINQMNSWFPSCLFVKFVCFAFSFFFRCLFVVTNPSAFPIRQKIVLYIFEARLLLFENKLINEKSLGLDFQQYSTFAEAKRDCNSFPTITFILFLKETVFVSNFLFKIFLSNLHYWKY